MADGVNAGEQSDRCLVEWRLGAPVLTSVTATLAASGLAMAAAPRSLVFASRA